MSEVALTGISVGRVTDDGFERVEVAVGQPLPSWVPKSDRIALRESGALGTPAPTVDAVEDKDAEIERLKALLAEAVEKAVPAAPPEPPVDSPTTKTTAKA